jgi:UDP-N-acetyl-D-mannosaminuronate dehydrogenase
VSAGHALRQLDRVAEAAKVIENTQRDLNIALVNELALIFNKMGIDTLKCWRRRARSGTSCRSAPAWSAATASAWIPTT